MSESQAARDHLALERVLFFSDAVFAIAITLLVIEIKVPVLDHGAGDGPLGNALGRMIPLFVGFVISFFLIGQTWVEHHMIGRLLRGFDRGLLWRNLGLLLFVAAMPFASALMSEYFGSRLATTFYALVFAGLGLAKAGLWRHAARRGLVDLDSPDAVRIGARVWATPITATGVAAAAMAGLPWPVMGFMLIPVVAQLLDRRARQAAGALAPAE
jgi:uncharacterized membrane protein